MNVVHPTAIIHPEAKIGKNVTIYPFVNIEKDVFVGDGCTLHNNVCLLNGCRLKKDVQVYHHAVLSGRPQDLKFRDEKTTVEVGERTVIKEYVTINRGTSFRKKTVLGADCLIMAYCHVAHDAVVGDKVILANGVQLAGHVEIDYHASIGGVVPVHQFVHIGAHSYIGGGYRINKNIPPYVTAMGEPLVFGGLNYLGLKRRGFSEATIAHIKRAYRILCSTKYLLREKIKMVKDSLEMTDEICTIVDFIEKSRSNNRGLIPFGRH